MSSLKTVGKNQKWIGRRVSLHCEGEKVRFQCFEAVKFRPRLIAGGAGFLLSRSIKELGRGSFQIWLPVRIDNNLVDMGHHVNPPKLSYQLH